jgi:transposase
MSQMTLLTGPERRRRWSEDERRQILTAAFAPGAIVADISRRYEISTSLIYVSLRQRPPGRGGSDHQMVGVSVDTMMVSTKPLMDTIADVGDGTRGASGER